MRIGFRPLAEDDLVVMHEWLNDPGVVRWWEGNDVSWPAVVRDYGPDTPDSTDHWIASLDGEGGLSRGGSWPSSTPTGFTTWIQIWMQDPATMSGFSASNGLALTAP